MPSAISDYALIGDGQTCALVAKTGAIDFLCLPRFDSAACFAALLGDDGNGCWRIAPAGQIRSVERRYRGDTLVLETLFETETGAARLIDFMPWQDGEPMVIRIVEGVRGTVEFETMLRLRFDYGRVAPWTARIDGGVCALAGAHQAVLHGAAAFELDDDVATARFTVARGRKAAFALCYAPSFQPTPARPDAGRLLRRTEKAWSDWIGQHRPPARWGDAVKRSLLTLRALTDRRTGGIVAAATLGLPEVPGGSMNWDYRFCWLRDATFTLTALLNAGFHEEATRWRDWILRAVAGRPDDMQIVYRIDGERRLDEHEATWLGGFGGARPVLIGNAASGQIQLDVYGELIDSFHVAARAGIARTPRDVAVETAIIRHLERAWDKPGADIWESRGDPQRYTYSQAMAWVAVHHFIDGVRTSAYADDALLGRMIALRDEIHATVCERGYSGEHGHFTAYFGGGGIDASLLLLPLIGFLPIDDPRVAGTIAAVERELMDGGLVRRKPAAHDGHDEGAFLACSCWLADCMTMQGRTAEAAALLDRVVALSNDIGLLAEEYHVPSRQMIGNIPQALTHLAVVNSALFQSGKVVQRGAS